MSAYDELNNKIVTLNEELNSAKNRVKILENTIKILVRKSDLATETVRINTSLSNMSSVITDLDNKIKKVYLPNDTKYYLDETELKNLRNKLRQLNAILIKVETLEKHVVEKLALIEDD